MASRLLKVERLEGEEETSVLQGEVPFQGPEMNARPWRLVVGAAALAVMMGGMAAKALVKSNANMSSNTAFQAGELQEWETLPRIDRAINQAKNIPDIPLRNLGELFYKDQPEELPWVRTECTIDTVQATAYLGQAVVFIYKAVDYGGFTCPDDSPEGCASAVAGVITSIAWVASYLSLAASSCAKSVNSAALCSADWTALMANFGEVATAGAAAKVDCDIVKGDVDMEKIKAAMRHLDQLNRFGAGPVALKNPIVRGGSGHQERQLKSRLDKYKEFYELKHQEVMRNYDIAQCVFDVSNSASYLVRAILQIRSAAAACSDPRACAINILNIISSFAWISQFTALAVSDCAPDAPMSGSQEALCTADISDIIAAVTNGPAAGIATVSDCADKPDPKKEMEYQPMD